MPVAKVQDVISVSVILSDVVIPSYFGTECSLNRFFSINDRNMPCVV